MNLTQAQFDYIEANTIRCEVSHRGGGIEIDATDYLDADGGFPLQMTAYQNYLGGGMTGAVAGGIQGRLRDYPKHIQTIALELNEALKEYFYNLSNSEVADYDEWAVSSDFDSQQSRPESAY